MPHLEEEFGTAGKSLPPTKIVLLGVAAVVLVALIWAVVQRPQSSATGTIDDIVSVEVPNQNSTMVGINVSVHNHGQKPFWVKSIEVDLDAAGSKFTDEAASAADFDRYFQAFPTLKEHALPALKPETMIEPNGDARGTIIVSFPVTPDGFASRKSIQVTIRPYDQPKSLVITK
ncbi:MAG: hypothetical protein LAO03_06415 [Acidobacteriia bacterium]|nr:hypothetical protein [Terriglobia bacterium]